MYLLNPEHFIKPAIGVRNSFTIPISATIGRKEYRSTIFEMSAELSDNWVIVIGTS